MRWAASKTSLLFLVVIVRDTGYLEEEERLVFTSIKSFLPLYLMM